MNTTHRRRSFFRPTGIAAALSLSFAAGAAHALAFTFQPVVFPNDTFTQLLGINNGGTIAGYHGAAINKGFTLTLPNSFTDENFPGSAQTQVVGINAAGQTAGFFVDAGGLTHGFTQVNGVFKTVDAPGTAFNQLLGLNNAGRLAGYSSTDPAGATLQSAFLGTQGSNVFSRFTFPAGTGNSQATGVNNAGVASGFYVDTGGVNHGFLSTDGVTPKTTDVPGSTFTQVLGLNNLGEAVGVTTINNVQHGFIDNNGAFQIIDDPLGLGSTTVNGVNDLGQLVGFYVNGAEQTVGFVATPRAAQVDAPALLPLMGIGGLALVGLRWRRRRA